MVILGVKLKNILCFDDFSMNFSYPKKLTNSLIPNENISNYPSFRYKKLNVIIGSNATGKTCFATAIWKILLFLRNKNINHIYEIVDKDADTSEITFDFVHKIENKDYLYRVKLQTNNKDTVFSLGFAYHFIELTNTTSYENSLEELNSFDYKYEDSVTALNSVNFDIGWHVALPATEKQFDHVVFADLTSEEEKEEYLNILNAVFKTLDPSISSVTKSNDSDDAYVIEQAPHKRKIIVQKNIDLSAVPNLSSGTKYGFNIANLIFSIKNKMNGVYFIDEQFTYVNSDIECAILSLMVSLIGDDEQIFFMTHNANVLDLGFPFHAFNFFKKTFVNGNPVIVSNCATEVENRNNVSAKTIIDNDMLATAPELSKIYALNEE